MILYNKIVDKIIDGEHQDEKGAATLTEFLLSDNTDGETTDYHRSLVLEVFGQYLKTLGGTVSRNDPFYQIALRHYINLNRDKIFENYSLDETEYTGDEVTEE